MTVIHPHPTGWAPATAAPASPALTVPAYIFDCSDLHAEADFWALYRAVIGGPDAAQFAGGLPAFRASLAGTGPCAPSLPCVFVFTQHERLRVCLGGGSSDDGVVGAEADSPWSPYAALISAIQDQVAIRLVLQ